VGIQILLYLIIGDDHHAWSFVLLYIISFLFNLRLMGGYPCVCLWSRLTTLLTGRFLLTLIHYFIALNPPSHFSCMPFLNKYNP